MEIKKEGEITITIPDEKPTEEEKPEVEKGATPPTWETVLARLDTIANKVNENSEALKAMKEKPKEKEKEVEKVEDEPTDEPKEEVVEKTEDKIDVVALIKEAVKNAVNEKIGDQPIQKRSTAIPEKPKTFDTPMEIPAELMLKADPESILKMGGYTTARR